MISLLPWQLRVVHSHDGLPDLSASKSTFVFVVFTGQLSLLFLWTSLGRAFWLSRWLIAVAGAFVCVNALTHIPKDRLQWDEPWLVCFCWILAATSAIAGALLWLGGYRLSPVDGKRVEERTPFRFQTRDLLSLMLAVAVLFATDVSGPLREVLDSVKHAFERRRSTVILYNSLGPAELAWLLAHAVVYSGILAGAVLSVLAKCRVLPKVILWVLLSAIAAIVQIGLLRQFQQTSFRYIHAQYAPTSWAAINCYVFYALFVVALLCILRGTSYRLLRRPRST